MADQSEDRRTEIRSWMDHVHKIVTMGIGAGIIWIVSTLTGTDTQVQLLNQRLDLLTMSIQDQMKDRYYQSDAVRDFALRDQRLRELEKDVSDVIKKINR